MADGHLGGSICRCGATLPEEQAKENAFEVTVAEMLAHSLKAYGIDHESVVRIAVGRWGNIDGLATKLLSRGEMKESEVAAELASVVARAVHQTDDRSLKNPKSSA